MRTVANVVGVGQRKQGVSKNSGKAYDFQTYQRYETGKLDLKMSTIHNICTSLQMSSDLLLGISIEQGSDTDGARGK